MVGGLTRAIANNPLQGLRMSPVEEVERVLGLKKDFQERTEMADEEGETSDDGRPILSRQGAGDSMPPLAKQTEGRLSDDEGYESDETTRLF